MSSYLITFDPGIRVAGVAVFKNSLLFHAGIAKNKELHARGPIAWKKMADAVVVLIENWLKDSPIEPEDDVAFVCELMQVYGGPAAKADPADLLELMGVNGAVCAQFEGPACGYTPREWKKAVPKDIHNKRILAKLAKEEIAVLEAEPSVTPSIAHNAIDAIGIGLFHLLRLRPARKGRVPLESES